MRRIVLGLSGLALAALLAPTLAAAQPGDTGTHERSPGAMRPGTRAAADGRSMSFELYRGQPPRPQSAATQRRQRPAAAHPTSAGAPRQRGQDIEVENDETHRRRR